MDKALHIKGIFYHLVLLLLKICVSSYRKVQNLTNMESIKIELN